MLGFDLHWWETAMLVSLGIAALAAVAVGVATTAVVHLQREEVKAAGVKIAEAAEGAAKANARAEEAKAASSEANARAAEANQKAEEERLARVQIEERLAWRRVDPKLYKHFVTELAPFAGSIIVLNPIGNGDPETDTFTEDIAKLLGDSHWQVQIARGNVAIPAPRGLICRVDASTPAGNALVEVLKQLPGATIIPTRLDGLVASIIIGLKPPP